MKWNRIEIWTPIQTRYTWSQAAIRKNCSNCSINSLDVLKSTLKFGGFVWSNSFGTTSYLIGIWVGSVGCRDFIIVCRTFLGMLNSILTFIFLWENPYLGRLQCQSVVKTNNSTTYLHYSYPKKLVLEKIQKPCHFSRMD